MKGNTAADAREAMRVAETAIGTGTAKSAVTKGFDGFKAESLPKPLTHPDMPDVKVIPYPLTVQDLPAYEPMKPMEPTRWPIEAIIDPFQTPFLHLVDFHETVMPEFESTA